MVAGLRLLLVVQCGEADAIGRRSGDDFRHVQHFGLLATGICISDHLICVDDHTGGGVDCMILS